MAKNLKRKCTVAMAVYLITMVAFYFIAGNDFRQGEKTTEMVGVSATTGELLAGDTLSQVFAAQSDTVESVTVHGATYGRSNSDELTFALLDESGEKLTSATLETNGLADNSDWTVTFSEPAGNCRDQILTLAITSARGTAGNAVTLYYGDFVSAGKFEISVQADEQVRLNGQAFPGELCFSVTGTSYYILANYYWYFVIAAGTALLYFCLRLVHSDTTGKSFIGLRILEEIDKYRFLLKQLVARDFKTKYKRSALGMLWSFMNPLLTMMVMYIVFATLFRTSIANFPVYLLTGIVCWNYFSECTAMCLTSITGNSALIQKVYVPKYMYPFSRAVSSLVNFGLSMIPLFIVLIITKTRFTAAFLLLPFPIVCLFLFTFGIGLLLASSMVFFRDMQFLWGVTSLLWMYLTPIFYDVSIIPARFMTLYKMNPLYHVVRIFRIILINGVSPEPKAYLLCMIAAIVPFIIGVSVFKKTQDNFTLYL